MKCHSSHLIIEIVKLNCVCCKLNAQHFLYKCAYFKIQPTANEAVTQLQQLCGPPVETRRLGVDTLLTLRCFSLPAQIDVSVVTLFCTQEHGLLLQDCFPKPPGLQALLALDVPYYYFSCKVTRGGRNRRRRPSARLCCCVFHHCSCVFGLKTHPAVISEGEFLSDGSK